MKNSKLVQLLKKLNKKEIRNFEKYLIGLYGNHISSIKLFQHLKQYYPKFQHKNIEKSYIAKTVLETNNLKRGLNEASQLYEWLEEFLVWDKIKNNKNTPNWNAIIEDIYREKGEIEKTKSLYEKRINKLNKQERKSQFDYLELMKINQKQYYNLYKNHFNKDIRLPYIQAVQHNLEVFYILSQMQFNCELICRNSISNEDNEIIDIEIEKPLKEILVVKLYVLMLNALKSEKLEDYSFAKDFLFKYRAYLSNHDCIACFGYLVNLLAKLLRKNEKERILELFELFKLGTENKLLVSNTYKKISTIRFNNIVNIAYTLKEFYWAEQFVKNYAKYLDEYDRDDTIELAEAILFLGRKDYKRVVLMLREKKYDNLGNEIRGKIIFISGLFELGGDDRIEQIWLHLDNLYRLIHRKRGINDTLKKGVKNYISILRKIIARAIEKEVLGEELSACEYIYFRSWLELKISQCSKI